MEKTYFQGQQNIGEGNRRGEDKILEEKLPWASAEYTGTGASQEIPHGLGVVPDSALVALSHIAAAPTTSSVVSMDTDKVVVIVTLNAKFKLLIF